MGDAIAIELNFEEVNDYVEIQHDPIFDFGEDPDFTIKCRLRTSKSADVSIVGIRIGTQVSIRVLFFLLNFLQALNGKLILEMVPIERT